MAWIASATARWGPATSVTPRVVPFPGHLEPAEPTDPEVDYLFTCSRLDGPKRHDLLVRAMASVPG